jgi:Na+-driven multidrug efflux pump
MGTFYLLLGIFCIFWYFLLEYIRGKPSISPETRMYLYWLEIGVPYAFLIGVAIYSLFNDS